MTRVILTYTDYAALPDDGRRYELHDGELAVTPSPGSRHQIVSSNLYLALRQHVHRHGLGTVLYAPLDCILADTTVVQPDIVFVQTADTARISERGIEGPPTLAIEIVSPSSQAVDRRLKLALYARYALPNYWIVDPAARLIEAHVLVDGSYRIAARLAGDEMTALPPFSDLEIDPASIWV